MVEIFLSKALICFSAVCYPALVGPRTPVGEFQMQVVPVTPPQYRGHVIKFADDPSNKRFMFAIHRPPSPARHALLHRAKRPAVTLGCVNIPHEVYDALVKEVRAKKMQLVIHP